MSIVGSLPNSLSNGTTADGSQVLGNDQYIANQVNANALALSGGALTGPLSSSSSAAFAGQLSGGGTTTNDSAASGIIGEYISNSIASGIGLTNNVVANITSVTLTAGDWDVWGTILALPVAGTTPTNITGSLSTVSATHPAAPNGGGYVQSISTFLESQPQALPVGLMRMSLNGSTTVYLVITVGFSGGSLSSGGFIGARRVR